MIAHVILFRPKPDLAAADRQTVLASLAAAADVPSVRSCRVGRRVRHGRAGYEQAMREDFEYAAILEFDDLEGLAAYLEHPRHAEASRHFMDRAAAALAYDYAFEDISQGWSLLDER